MIKLGLESNTPNCPYSYTNHNTFWYKFYDNNIFRIISKMRYEESRTYTILFVLYRNKKIIFDSIENSLKRSVKMETVTIVKSSIVESSILEKNINNNELVR